MFGMPAFLTADSVTDSAVAAAAPGYAAGVTHGPDARAEAADVARYNVNNDAGRISVCFCVSAVCDLR
jgi:hypothetical protein